MNGIKKMSLTRVVEEYERAQKVRVMYNGDCIFRGSVGGILTFVNSWYWNKPANVYTKGLSDDTLDIFVQY